jgi:ribosome biogenesis GTPase A
MRAFSPDSYKKEKWLYDTPGVILPEQVKREISYSVDLILYLLIEDGE